jgi:NADH-ubiquinone oxidoreductase chain 4
MVAFFMKIPIYLLHLWLPKAHVQAPVSGSIILAGVLLKLGGYGLYRAYPLINKFAVNFNFIWITLNLIGGILVRLNCLRLLDMKSLVAYSSVSHIGVILCGLLRFTCWGLNGSYLFIIGHGLCSSCLFLLVNISYERLGRRSLILNKGLLNFMPSIGIWWFLICVGNMGCPPSLNLMGEIFLINGIIRWSTYSFLGLSLISLLGAAFCLYLYSSCQHGKSNQLINYYSRGRLREYLTLFLHWIPFNLLILLRDQLIIF